MAFDSSSTAHGMCHSSVHHEISYISGSNRDQQKINFAAVCAWDRNTQTYTVCTLYSRRQQLFRRRAYDVCVCMFRGLSIRKSEIDEIAHFRW